MQEMTHLKTECSELRKSNSENQSELDNIQEQIDAEKDTINSIRKTKINLLRKDNRFIYQCMNKIIIYRYIILSVY